MKKLTVVVFLFCCIYGYIRAQPIASWSLASDGSPTSVGPGITANPMVLGSGVIDGGFNQTHCGCTGRVIRGWNQGSTAIATAQTNGHWVEFSFTVDPGAQPVQVSNFQFTAGAGLTSNCNTASQFAIRWHTSYSPEIFHVSRTPPCAVLLRNLPGVANGCATYNTNYASSGTCSGTSWGAGNYTSFPITVNPGQTIYFRIIVGSTHNENNWRVAFRDVSFEGSNPLSVTLNSFNGNCLGNGTEVSWSTASEQNASHFDLERSRDGQVWEKVSTVPASENSTMLKTYSVHDPVRFSSVGYYRLRQVDFDGGSEIHGPVIVNCDSDDNSLIVFPNPSTGEFSVEINSSETLEESSVVVYDLSGKQLLRQQVNVKLKGTNMVYFADSNLAKGTYLVAVESKTKNNFIPVKLIIQ